MVGRVSSLDLSMFTRRKMSQAEKQRGWVRMRNVPAVKISIQGLTGLAWRGLDPGV